MTGSDNTRPSQASLTAAFQQLSSAVAIVKHDGRIAHLNPAAERLIGVTQGTRIPRHIGGKSAWTSLLARWESAVGPSGDRPEHPVVWGAPGQSLRNLRVRLSPLDDGYLLTFTDSRRAGPAAR